MLWFVCAFGVFSGSLMLSGRLVTAGEDAH